MIIQPTVSSTPNLLLLKRSIWLYLLLLLFEGALRKWVLPSLSNPLLIVRDPLALFIIYFAIKDRLLQWNVVLGLVVGIHFISMLATLFLGHGNVWVMLYGLRIYLLHFPLIFIIGKVMDRRDVEQMGRFIMLLSIPMVGLILTQFYSPPTAWVNIGVGGEGTAGFSGAMDFQRPPGTFSFTSGNVMFWGLVQFFLMYFLIQPSKISKVVLVLAAISLLIAIPTSISRSLFFQSFVAFAFLLLAISNRPQQVQKIVLGAMGVSILILALLQLPFFNKNIEVFTARFESANEVEGGIEGVLLDRYLGGMIGAIMNDNVGDAPILGQGLGLGTNVGSQLMVGSRTFLISEGEWGRVIGEQGVFLGLLLILCRLILSFHIFRQSLVQLKLNNNLPIILAGNMLLYLPQGQWSLPTFLGFGVLVCGMTLAACNSNEEKK